MPVGNGWQAGRTISKKSVTTRFHGRGQDILPERARRVIHDPLLIRPVLEHGLRSATTLPRRR